MPPARIVLYTGKGGVGKTTTAAATAVCAAERGARTLVVSADAAHSLADVLGVPLGAEPTPVAVVTAGDSSSAGRDGSGRLHAAELDARVEMARHWGRIRDYLVSLFRYQGIEEVVAEELALLPGAEEITTLLAVEDRAQSGDYDLIVVDCAPTDTALRLVTLPEVAHGALRLLLRVQQTLSTVVTPLARNLIPLPLPDAAVFRDAEVLLYRHLRRLHRRLTGNEASIRLVVTPERMVIDEARRAFTDLCLFGVPCDAVIMNRMLPPEVQNEAFFRDWAELQKERCREVGELFAPLALLTAPLQDDEVVGVERLSLLGAALFGAGDPGALLSEPPRIRFARHADGYQVSLPLPGADPADLDVSKIEDELVIRAGSRRRALKLPRRIAGLDLGAARLEAEELIVRFDRPGGA